MNFHSETNPQMVLRENEHILPNDITLFSLGTGNNAAVSTIDYGSIFMVTQIISFF